MVAAEKVALPSPFKRGLGFGSAMEKQYRPFAYDYNYKSEFNKVHRAIRGDREIYRDELEAQGIKDKKVQKRMLDKKHPLPKKSEFK